MQQHSSPQAVIVIFFKVFYLKIFAVSAIAINTVHVRVNKVCIVWTVCTVHSIQHRKKSQT